MKYFKFLLINIIVFGVLFFSLSLLFPNTINTNKAITILAGKEKVYNTIKSIQHWKQWNAFDKNGSVAIALQSSSNDTIATVWKHQDGQVLYSVHNLVAISDDSTVVNWSLQEKIKWYQPLKKFAALFTNKKTGYAIEISLDNLKKQIETP